MFFLHTLSLFCFLMSKSKTLRKFCSSDIAVAATLNDLMNPCIFAFLDFLQGLESKDASGTGADPLDFKMQDLGVEKFDSVKLYHWWGELARVPIQENFKAFRDLFTGVLSLPLVGCEDFFRRTAIPVGAKIEWPNGFNIQVFASKYFAGGHVSELQFQTGGCQILPACMLAELIPVAHEILCSEESMVEARKASSLADVISSAPGAAPVGTSTSTRLAKIESDVLSKLPKIFESTKKGQMLVQSSEWKEAHSKEFSRLEDFVALGFKKLGKILAAIILEVSKDLETSATSLFERIKKSKQEEKDSHLLKMVDLVSKAVDNGSTSERLESDFQKYVSVLEESIADLAYVSSKKICELGQWALRFHEKLTALKENLSVDFEQDLKNLKDLADMKHAATLKVKLLLADLVATRLGIYNM